VLAIDDLKEAVADSIRARAPQAIELSHRLHAHPELGYEEHYAAEQVTALIEGEGFKVDREFKGLQTAFSARYGEGRFRATIVAEYDALPEIGHACGHNIIAATAVLAASGLREAALPLDLTIEVLGTPAEEGGGGKIVLAERGAFDETDVAMMVHPAPFEDERPSFLAAAQIRFEFVGRSSHASAAPTQAINAADAATLAQVAVGLLRQQLPDDVRVHALLESAGVAVNVIPGLSHLVVEVRARSVDVLARTIEQVDACFYGAAQATGCSVNRTTLGHAYPNVRQSPVLAELYRCNAEAVGRTFKEDPAAKSFVASTDFGAVSHLVPSLHPHLAICDPPVANHQVAFAEAAASPRADQAIVDGAIAMAWTLIDVARRPELLKGGSDR
jgi:amidohydrolase